MPALAVHGIAEFVCITVCIVLTPKTSSLCICCIFKIAGYFVDITACMYLGTPIGMYIYNSSIDEEGPENVGGVKTNA